jgi:NADH-quinone oxidoreductase subunit N
MNIYLFGTESFYFLCTLCFLALSFGSRRRPARDYNIAFVLAAAGVLISLSGSRLQGELFFDVYRADLFSQVFKIFLAAGLFLIVCICRDLKGIEEHLHPEFYFLLFTCTLAMMMLVSAVHLLIIYISLELSSYSLYILVSLRRERGFGIEAGLKYFLVGVTASAVMIFGLALLYGSIQETYLTRIFSILPESIHRPTVILGLLLTLSGFFFKLAVFPFHFWAPDTYQGAANPVAAYIATASKVAAIAILIRMVALSGADGTVLAPVLVSLSIVTMTVGNLAAIAQQDFKRLLAYSSIAHAGYVLIGIASMNPAGYSGAIFYAVSVLMMKFTCFLVLVKTAYEGENLQIGQLAGLHRRSPMLAMALFLSLFSLAGIPPTIGFTGKFLVFAAAMSKGYFTLVLIAMINVVISLYYYLMAIRAAYLLEPKVDLGPVRTSPSMKVLLLALMGGMVAAGLFPTYLIQLADAAAQALP